MILQRFAITNAALAAAVLSTPALLSAQQSSRALNVVGVTPQSATPFSVITISFDAPVFEVARRAIDPARFVRVVPAIQARFEWRDPSTIRIVPTAPLASGAQLRIVVDTNFRTYDGRRLRLPARHTVSVRHAITDFTLPEFDAKRTTTLDAGASIRIVVTGSVDTASLASMVMLETNSSNDCSVARYRYRLASNRPIATGRYTAGRLFVRGNRVDTLNHLLQFDPVRAVPEGCAGTVHIPVFSNTGVGRATYAVLTPKPFGLVDTSCLKLGACATTTNVRLQFTAPVERAELRRHVHFEPSSAFNMDSMAGSVDTWTIPATLEYRSKFTIRIDTALRDVHGRRMSVESLDGEVPDATPSVRHALGGWIVSRSAPLKLAVQHVNVASVELRLWRLTDSAAVANANMLPWQRRLFADSLAIRHVAAVRAPFNESRTSDIVLPAIVQLASREFWAVTVVPHTLQQAPKAERGSYSAIDAPPARSAPVDTSEIRAALLQFSNLALHVRAGGRAPAVFVTRTSDGSPVANATVSFRTVRGVLIRSMRADSLGVVAFLDSSLFGTVANTIAVVEAQHGDDRVLLPLTEAPSGRQGVLFGPAYEWPFVNASTDRVVLWNDRTIYRPGEMVHFAAIHRAAPEFATLDSVSADSVRFELYLNGVTERPSSVVRLSSFGTATDSLRLPPSVQPGDQLVTAQLYRQGRWADYMRTSFRVAEYRSPEFLIRIDTVARPIVAGDSIDFTVSAKYLHAAPVQGATVHSALTIAQGNGSPVVAGVPNGFQIGGPVEYSNSAVQREFLVDTLDGAGTAELVRAVQPLQRGYAARATLISTVTDISGPQVTSSVSRHVHPATFYLALRLEDSLVSAGDSVRVDVAAVSINGRRLNGREFTAVLTHHRTVSDELGRRFMGVSWDTLATMRGRMADSLGQIVLPVDSGGLFNIEVTARDERGRLTSSSIGFDTRTARYVGRFEPGDSLILSKRTYAIGDTAIVSFTSRYDSAEAWITLQRDGVLRSERRTVPVGVSNVRIPITTREAPNVFVGVTLVPKGIEWYGTSSWRERLFHAYATLRVDQSHKLIAMTLAVADSTYGPGDTASIRLQLRDNAGRPVSGEAIVWAVDEANLALAKYEPPKLFDAVHGVLIPEISAWSTAGYTHDRLAAVRNAFGGIGNGMKMESALDATSLLSESVVTANRAGSGDVRSFFRTTAFFRAGIRVDVSGNATIRQKLPDNLTRYRVYAMFIDSTNRVGQAETQFSVSRSLVIRAALPRFLRKGDSVVAGAVVGTTDGSTQSVLVLARLSGLRASTDTTRRLLASGETVPAKFSLVATADSAHATFIVQGDQAADGVSAPIVIKPASPARTSTWAGTVRDSMRIRFALPASTDVEKSTVTVRIGNSPLPAMQLALDHALRYPFDGSEQLASRIRVLANVIRLERGGFALKHDQVDLRQELDRLVVLLSSRAEYDGRVNYWESGSWSTPWLSAYAGLALADARRAGANVDIETVRRIGNYAKRHTADTTFALGGVAERIRLAEQRMGGQLASAWLERRLERDSGSTAVRRLFQRRAQLTWEDRAWLAELLHETGNTVYAQIVMRELLATTRRAGTAIDVPLSRNSTGFPATVRGIARLLSATLVVLPHHPDVPRMVERVAMHGHSSSAFAWNTQDYGWATPALARFIERAPSKEISVRAADRRGVAFSLLTQRMQAVDTTVDLAPYARRVGDSLIVSVPLRAIGATQNSAAFVAVSVLETPRGIARTPDRRGLKVERWIERYGDGAPVTEVAEGELVNVRLRIVSAARRDFVALEDWLPAGLEVVDRSLRTSSSLAAYDVMLTEEAAALWREESEMGFVIDRHSLPIGPWNYRELRDDKVRWFARHLPAGAYTVTYVARATTAGKFARPPAHAVEMYNPGVNGRSEGGWFGVRSR